MQDDADAEHAEGSDDASAASLQVLHVHKQHMQDLAPAAQLSQTGDAAEDVQAPESRGKVQPLAAVEPEAAHVLELSSSKAPLLQLITLFPVPSPCCLWHCCNCTSAQEIFLPFSLLVGLQPVRTGRTQTCDRCLQATVRWQDAEELASAAASHAEAGQEPALEAGARQAPAEQKGGGQSHARPAAAPADAPPAAGAVPAPGLGAGTSALPPRGRPSALGGGADARAALAAPAPLDWHNLPESGRARSVPVPAEVSQLNQALQQEVRSSNDPGAP